MLSFSLKHVFALRGISNPYSQLVKLGISRPTAWNILENGVSSINNKHLEKICEFLNCTPNDLYEWKPSANTHHVDSHPLRGLRRDKTAARYNELLRSVPLDKIGDVETMLERLSAAETADGETSEPNANPDSAV